jgi:5'-nucleotidase
VVRAYGALHYDAMAIGNHEFDYGPVGDAATPRQPGDDPRGALKARAAEAPYPFLAANVLDGATRAPVAWPNVHPTVTVEAAGVKIGLVGVTTTSTPRTTIAANIAGLVVSPLTPAIAGAARELRAAGVGVVVVAAHAGGGCQRLDDPDELSSCDPEGEIFQVARALGRGEARAGAVDAVVAGHTHDGIAQRVAGIPIVQSFAEGRAFGRIDLTIERGAHPGEGRVVAARIFPPQPLCQPARCAGERYEGAPVIADPAVERAIAGDLERARSRRESPLGVTVKAPVTRAHKVESSLGNLFADLMRAARPGADVALTNGGGLRADLPAGPLSYGRLFEAAPFDNRFATVSVTGADLARMVARNLARSSGIISLSGVRAFARCADGQLAVTLQGPGGKPIAPDQRLVLLLSDFLATGGDGLLPDELQRAVKVEEGLPIRDEMARVLRARGGALSGDDRAIYDPSRPRIVYPGPRPVRCK